MVAGQRGVAEGWASADMIEGESRRRANLHYAAVFIACMEGSTGQPVRGSLEAPRCAGRLQCDVTETSTWYLLPRHQDSSDRSTRYYLPNVYSRSAGSRVSPKISIASSPSRVVDGASSTGPSSLITSFAPWWWYAEFLPSSSIEHTSLSLLAVGRRPFPSTGHPHSLSDLCSRATAGLIAQTADQNVSCQSRKRVLAPQ